jgi:hypothetical protein
MATFFNSSHAGLGLTAGCWRASITMSSAEVRLELNFGLQSGRDLADSSLVVPDTE